MLPVPFSDAVTNAMTFAIRTDDGFAEADTATLRDVGLLVSPLLEIQALRQIEKTVLETLSQQRDPTQGDAGLNHARQRLDFTVIGPAVNRVSRIGGLCSELDIPLLT